jgi:hypothetical protein
LRRGSAERHPSSRRFRQPQAPHPCIPLIAERDEARESVLTEALQNPI